MQVSDAIEKVSNKFSEVAKALGIPAHLLYRIDEHGVPALGFKPGILFDRDASKLGKITPINIPATFFITGDTADTRHLGKINTKFKRFENMGMPNSHRIAQSLICKVLLEKPIFIKNKPLIPIGIDNYLFASPDDIVKRLKALKIYSEAVSYPLSIIKRWQLETAIENIFSESAKQNVKINEQIIQQITRIFPNALKTLFTNEPPSSTALVGNLLAKDKPLAIVQMEFGLHPTYLDFSKNYYLYLSTHPLNNVKHLPKSKKSLVVSILPVMKEFMQIKSPPKSKVKKVVISSGGAAGRIKRIVKELQVVNLTQKIEYLILTGEKRDSMKYIKLKNMINKGETNRQEFKLIPKISLNEFANLVENSHSTIALPGTYSTLGTLASGRPFGAIVDTRKSKDKIFTDHVKGNAYFAKKALKYPVVIIKDTISSQDILKLIDDNYINKAYKRAVEKGGVRDMFRQADQKWRDIFLQFLKY